MRTLLCLLFAFAAQALIVTQPLAPRRAALATSVDVVMKKTGCGSSPNRDKFTQKSRGALRKALYEADSAENVQAKLLTPLVEQKLLKMNWKLRHSMALKIKKRAAQFDVEIPAGFGAFDHLPKNARKHTLNGAF